MIPVRPQLYSAQPEFPAGVSPLPPDASLSGQDLREGPNIAFRPTQISIAHIYNLRNQTWAIPRLSWDGDDTTKADTIVAFRNAAGKYPANSDSISPFIYPNTSADGNKDVERFNVRDCVGNPIGSSMAPTGYFIIDAMERGQSRINEAAALNRQYGLSFPITSLPQDKTPGGPTVVAEYAGRVFYGGFSGEVIGEDKCSPKLSSYIMFSQTVTDISMIDTCYQQADPTNKDDASLVATDGGFIRIEGAYEINQLVALGDYLFIFAKNGVWKLGGTGQGFSATGYQVTKLTTKGSSSPASVVVVDTSIIYWAQDSIYTVSQNQFGDYVVDNLTKDKIQTFYNSIDAADKSQAKGVYDSYQRKVSWLYGNRDTGTGLTKELILDLNTGAYTLFEISNLGEGSRYPMVLEGVLTNPFAAINETQEVEVSSGDQVFVGIDDVTATITTQSSISVEVKYLCVTDIAPSVKISFGSYKEPLHYDWKSIDDVGVDAPAYLLTGKVSAGDNMLKKSSPYVTFHLMKTETGFVESPAGSGEYVVTDPSSCLVQAQWGWTNSAASNKWGKQFQAYRLTRHWTPSNLAGTFDNGYSIMDSKCKLRGNGPSLALLIKSEPGKHLSLYGWSMLVESVGHV